MIQWALGCSQNYRDVTTDGRTCLPPPKESQPLVTWTPFQFICPYVHLPACPSVQLSRCPFCIEQSSWTLSAFQILDCLSACSWLSFSLSLPVRVGSPPECGGEPALSPSWFPSLSCLGSHSLPASLASDVSFSRALAAMHLFFSLYSSHRRPRSVLPLPPQLRVAVWLLCPLCAPL